MCWLPPSASSHRNIAQEPDGAILVYTWMDATLGELTELVQEVRACLSGWDGGGTQWVGWRTGTD